MKKSTFLSLLAVLFLVVVLGSFTSTPDSSKIVRAGTGENISGWAWANTPQSSDDPITGTDQGVGWISFNSLNCDSDDNGLSDGTTLGCPVLGTPIPNYGVNVDTQTGNFSGFAWSDNIGWISFNREDTGNPPEEPFNADLSTDPIAKLDGVSYAVTGWARALSGLDSSTDFDGWIKLSGVSIDGSLYGITLVASEFFDGYAWGGDVIGWVNFNFDSEGGSGVRIGAPVVTGGLPANCGDGLDNDSDNLSDKEDPDCYTYTDFYDADTYTYDATRNEGFASVECVDWLDNDNDGSYDTTGISFDSISNTPVNSTGGADTDCSSIYDDSEFTQTVAVCGDGTWQAPASVEECEEEFPESYAFDCVADFGFTSGGTIGCYSPYTSNECTYDLSSCGGAGCNNNGVCDEGETAASCPSDCLIFEEF